MTSASTPPTSTHPTKAPPPTTFFTGTWYVNHSTLPMWKDKRNVHITYSPLPPSTPTSTTTAQVPRLDDLVEYQSLTSDKIKTVHGIDTPSGTDTSAWDWRGKGWLKVASSHWEVLDWSTGDGSAARRDPSSGACGEGSDEGQGVGEEGGGGEGGQEGEEVGGEDWAVIWFQKTIFTPEGIDIFSRRKEGLREGTVQEIKERLRGRYGGLSEGLFEVRRD